MATVDTETPGRAVLVVDDDPTVLSALVRLLRPDGVTVLTAAGGERALEVLEEHAPTIGVVVSDYSMPGMSGAEVLRAVRLRWPDITRVLLTGNADLAAAARAVNEGQLSRLCTKPWQADELRQAVAQSLEQHRVLRENRRLRQLADEQAARLEQWNQRLEAMVAERTAELERANAGLQRGMLDTVRILVGFLERRLPGRAARCREIARLGGRLADRAGATAEEVRWIQVAALIHDIGLVGLPDVLLRRAPTEMLPAARAQYQRHSIIGQSMLSEVEQLTTMATWIRHHHERWDGYGYPDGLAGAAIPLGSRIIALADGYLEAVALEGDTASKWRQAERTHGAFDPELLPWLDDEVEGRPGRPAPEPTPTALADLEEGMVLTDAIRTTSGAILVPAGEVMTRERLIRVRQHLANGVLVDSAQFV
jgi:response regulator RpfG family c-di-GMP phosphodiesterase